MLLHRFLQRLGQRHQSMTSLPFFSLIFCICFVAGLHAQTVTFPGRLERMGINAQGIPANNLVAQSHLSDDGRYVVFSSRASNIVPGVVPSVSIDGLPAGQWYLYDRMTQQTECISLNNDGAALIPAGPPFTYLDTEFLAISSDRRFFVFTYITSSVDGAVGDWWIRDRQSRTTRRLSFPRVRHGFSFVNDSHQLLFRCGNAEVCRLDLSTGEQTRTALPPPYVDARRFSKNGRFAACYAPGPAVGLTADYIQLARCDLMANTTIPIGILPSNSENSLATFRFSAAGDKLIFSSLIPSDPSYPEISPGEYNVYLWQENLGTSLLSVGQNRNPANDFLQPQGVDISDDGKRVAFVAYDANLGLLPTSFYDFQSSNVVYIRDLDTNFNRYAELTKFAPDVGTPGGGACERGTPTLSSPLLRFTSNPHCPELSGDGKTLAFSTWDWRFIENDLPSTGCPPGQRPCAEMMDAFVRELGEPVVTTISVSNKLGKSLLALGLLALGMLALRRQVH